VSEDSTIKDYCNYEGRICVRLAEKEQILYAMIEHRTHKSTRVAQRCEFYCLRDYPVETLGVPANRHTRQVSCEDECLEHGSEALGENLPRSSDFGADRKYKLIYIYHV
jgi:hypothetical protein